MKKIRAFIAIELSGEIKQELSSLTERLKASGADAKWVNPQNIHLTLKFLGNISAEMIENVKTVLDSAGSKFNAFRITISGLGGFPGTSSPRVIWVGIRDGQDSIKAIHSLLEDELERFGFEKDKRPYSAHLTIGRVRSLKNKQNLKSAMEECARLSLAHLDVDHITLFQSTLTPKGPTYTPLHKVRLGA